jgi:hypothetical protein
VIWCFLGKTGGKKLIWFRSECQLYLRDSINNINIVEERVRKKPEQTKQFLTINCLFIWVGQYIIFGKITTPKNDYWGPSFDFSNFRDGQN